MTSQITSAYWDILMCRTELHGTSAAIEHNIPRSGHGRVQVGVAGAHTRRGRNLCRWDEG